MNDFNPNRVAAGVPSGGQFAASARAEAEITLDGSTLYAKGQRLADAISAAGHPGTIEPDGPDSFVWTEADADGTEARYRLTWLDNVTYVESLDTDAEEEITSLSFTGEAMQPATVAKALDQCRRHRADIMASSAAFADISTGIVSRDYDAGKTTVELPDGTVTFGPYNSGNDGWNDGPYLNVALDDEAYQVHFATPGDPTSDLEVVRDDDGESLKRWEAHGVLARAQAASGRTLGDALRSIESSRLDVAA